MHNCAPNRASETVPKKKRALALTGPGWAKLDDEYILTSDLHSQCHNSVGGFKCLLDAGFGPAEEGRGPRIL